MILKKKERRLTIAIGLIIGITISSLIVRHALNVKGQQAAQRPGNYSSQHSASGNISFPPLPESIKKAIPNGIVVHFEGNQSSLHNTTGNLADFWVIETSGSFRSERLFILAEADYSFPRKVRFSRASEIYVKLRDGVDDQDFEKELDIEKFKIIGQNSLTGEYIVQVRNFSPSELAKAENFLQSLKGVLSARLSPWNPSR